VPDDAPMTNKFVVTTALTAIVLASAGAHSVEREKAPSAPVSQLTTFRVAPVTLAALVTPNALYAAKAPVAASGTSGFSASSAAAVFTRAGAAEGATEEREIKTDQIRELFTAATLATPTANASSGGPSAAFASAAPAITAADINDFISFFISNGDEPGENGGWLIGNGAAGAAGQDGGRGGLLWGNGGRGGDGAELDPDGGNGGAPLEFSVTAGQEVTVSPCTSRGGATCSPVRVAKVATEGSWPETVVEVARAEPRLPAAKP
jgi:hypothetical protein